MIDSKELDVLFPNSKTITVNDKTIIVTPFKVGKIKQVITHTKSVGGFVAAAFQKKDISLDMLTELFEQHTDEMLELISIGTGLPRTEVDELDIAQALDLLAAVVEVNSDFFIQKVIPQLTAAVVDLAGKMQTKQN